MTITIKEVKKRSDLRKFIHLPAKIHKNHSTWVPPIYFDEWAYYNKKKNHAFEYCDTILLLAYKDNKIAGRIMGIINHKYNARKNETNVRFCSLEVWNDQEVANALLKCIENWGRENGMTKIVGPFGFSDKDPQGFLIKGFEENGIFSNIHNYEYLTDILTNSGFTKDIDVFSYKGEIPQQMPELYQKIFERIKRNFPNLRQIVFHKRKDVKPWIKPSFMLINQTFKDIYGFEEVSEKEMQEFQDRYLIFIRPEAIRLIVDENDRPVAFFAGMQDISDAIRACKGYILPFGIFRILRATRKSELIVFLLGAIHPDYQGKGISTFLLNGLIDGRKKYGLKYFESNYELEDNRLVRAEMERMGGKVHKHFRIFQKSLVD